MNSGESEIRNENGEISKSTVVLIIAFILVFGFFCYATVEWQQNKAIFSDILEGKFTGGALTGHFETGCISADDAYNYGWAGSDSTSLEANSQVRTKLLESGRCAISPENSRFDMTAEGMLRFTTPHGVIDLYPVSKGTP